MTDPYMTIPVSEFENLHEDNRLLRERIAQLEAAIEQTWRPEVKALRVQIQRLIAAHPHAEPKPGCEVCAALAEMER